MSPITTHVLDISRGKPAAGVPVSLFIQEAGAPVLLGSGQTDGEGHLRSLLKEDADLRPGVYRICFDTAAYYRTWGISSFYPEVNVTFLLQDPMQRFHLPLLLSPFGYSTHRG